MSAFAVLGGAVAGVALSSVVLTGEFVALVSRCGIFTNKKPGDLICDATHRPDLHPALPAIALAAPLGLGLALGGLASPGTFARGLLYGAPAALAAWSALNAYDAMHHPLDPAYGPPVRMSGADLGLLMLRSGA